MSFLIRTGSRPFDLLSGLRGVLIMHFKSCYLVYSLFSTVVIIPFKNRLIALRFVMLYLGMTFFTSNDWFISDSKPEYPFL